MEFIMNRDPDEMHERRTQWPRPKENIITQSTTSELRKQASYRSIEWRGCGGVLTTTTSEVEFDRQLDKVSIWMDGWSHQQTCRVLEELLRHSAYTQIQFLNTVLQPSLHRDFMYTARSRFPEIEFSPVSTYVTRSLKKRTERFHLDTFYRVDSAYRQTEDDILQLKLPHLQQRPNYISQRAPDVISSCSHLDRHTYRTKIQNHRYATEQIMDRWVDCGRIQKPSIIQDTVSRFIKMPVRRHIQNEQMMTQQLNNNKECCYSSGKGCNSVKSWSQSQPHKHRKASMSSFDSVAIYAHKTFSNESKQIIKWYSNEWNGTRKNEFLHKLILKLDPRQHYFLTSLLSIKQHKDIVGLLPKKLALTILNYLSPKELLIACQVCRKWEYLANTNTLWVSKCRKVNLEVPIPYNPNWKDVFKKNLYLRLNWRKGLFRTVDLCGHKQSVLCVTCDFPYLASGSADKTIKVWHTETGQLQQTLKGHTGGIWGIQFFTKHLLISGSFDCTIRIWNLRTRSTTRTLLGHKGQIWCLKRQGLLLVSGSQDRTAKIWDIGRCLLVHTLRGHSGAVFSVDVSEDCSSVITASADKSIRLWTAGTGDLVKVIFVSPTTSVMSVSYSQGYLACSYDGIVCLLREDTLVMTFEEHSKRVECVNLKITDAVKGEGYIVSAGKDGLIKLWDTTKANSVQTFNCHDNTVKCVYVNSLYIISASSDTKVRLWDFNIGMPTDENEDLEEDEELRDENKSKSTDN